MPDANDSGSDAYGSTGVGDQRQDYAQFTVVATDSRGGSSSPAVAPAVAVIKLRLVSELRNEGARCGLRILVIPLPPLSSLGGCDLASA